MVVQDLVEARKWFELAANQGIAETQFNLGVMYFISQGAEPGVGKALLWIEKAAI